MDDASLIDQLPEAHAVALRLTLAGYTDETVAVALGVPVQSVSVTLRVARLKLSQLEEAERGSAAGA